MAVSPGARVQHHVRNVVLREKGRETQRVIQKHRSQDHARVPVLQHLTALAPERLHVILVIIIDLDTDGESAGIFLGLGQPVVYQFPEITFVEARHQDGDAVSLVPGQHRSVNVRFVPQPLNHLHHLRLGLRSDLPSVVEHTVHGAVGHAGRLGNILYGHFSVLHIKSPIVSR